MLTNLRIGTSGWSYPSGRGTWNGIFYPPAPKARATKGSARPKFDELAYYAEHFDTVEVNSTFYRVPEPAMTTSWIRRTPGTFLFAVKLFQKFTHPDMYLARDGVRDWDLSRADFDLFRGGIGPIVEAGRLAAVLAQFPASFKNDDAARDYVIWLLRAFSDHRVAVELRHASWSDDLGATLKLLNEFQAAWVQIDEPKFRFSIRQNYLPNIKGFYYMRLHGRNAKQWWRHEKSEDRYNYLYSSDELKEFSETLGAARRLVQKAYLFTNNHYSAQSVANAKMIQEQLGEPVRGDIFIPEQTPVESRRRARGAKVRPLLQ